MPTFLHRWLGAGRLDEGAFAAARIDARALPQAFAVVLAGGLGRGLGALPEEGWPGLVGSPAVGLVIWIVAAVLVWAIAVEILGHACELAPLLRALGFAAAPLPLLALCAVLPFPVARAWWFGVHAWATLAFVVAVRGALGLTRLRSLLLCAAALGAAFVLLALAGAVLVGTLWLD